ncbi:rCG28845, isoform CRA_b [Rattus norvegicus]|uniref:RCG28845, isoform CRA_b n=1 Tax=Rattus norvegicus TaxID=10116 RepID=A6HVD3_RAT|nr:rCG28845, isoform CRA_b [Rattus norvegicus]
MAEEMRQELSALAAIFCGPHEWEMLSCSVRTALLMESSPSK